MEMVQDCEVAGDAALHTSHTPQVRARWPDLRHWKHAIESLATFHRPSTDMLRNALHWSRLS